MRAPCPPEEPIDAARRASWLARFQGYRVELNEAGIHSWLSQFSARHQPTAARVLDAVEFVTHHEMENALRAALEDLPGWHRDDARRQGQWRFVAFGAPGSSGDRMLHQFRVANRLDFDTYEDLFIHKSELLAAALGPNDTVVLVDDFAGSGEQVCSAWTRNLSELLAAGPKAYLILVGASSRAVERIGSETRLLPCARRVFQEDDNLFSDNCNYFTDEERAAILEYCNLADRRQPRGYGNCGLLVVLAHRCPNNSLPILHASNRRFRGLFPRS